VPRLETVARRSWALLPAKVRGSNLVARPKERLLSVLDWRPSPGDVRDSEGESVGPGGDVDDEQRVVRTLDELDEMLAMLDEAAAVSDDELRRAFLTFRMELELDLPADPFSDEYRQKVFELYEWLHGRPYEPCNEVTPFDVEAAADSPFPYVTHSAQTVGNHLIAVGHVIRTLDLPPGSRVLEFGPGWGNTTLALAQMGHHVTAIDIEPRFVELILARAERVHVTVDARVGDFALINELEGRYDAVLFFESFHHAADHLAVLAGLDRVVEPGGRVLFAAEPITEAFPVPWGLRFEGESVWAIRRNGWFELGFKDSYFRQALDRFGWRADVVVCPDTPWGIVYVAQRQDPH
jgi:ubiquinone/menaquinone biosynthesis C-methylase UbiE